jgi:hypothetical protein
MATSSHSQQESPLAKQEDSKYLVTLHLPGAQRLEFTAMQVFACSRSGHSHTDQPTKDKDSCLVDALKLTVSYSIPGEPCSSLSGLDSQARVSDALEKIQTWAELGKLNNLVDALPESSAITRLLSDPSQWELPSKPENDTSEVLDDTTPIEVCKGRLRPAFWLCGCTCKGRLRPAFWLCGCTHRCVFFCSGFNALLFWLHLFFTCCCKCQGKWVTNVVSQRQYDATKDKSKSKVTDPVFCVGDLGVTVEPPPTCSRLARKWCFNKPGNDIDELGLMEGLLIQHFFRTLELALLFVLALAFIVSVGVAIFGGRPLSSPRPVTIADTYLQCTQGLRTVEDAPQPLACFLANATVSPSAILDFAQAMQSSAGALSFSTSLLAASACAPVLSALTSKQPQFIMPGLMQKLLRFAPEYVFRLQTDFQFSITAWPLFPLAAFLLISRYAFDQRKPVPRKGDSLSRLFTAVAKHFMM